MKNIGITLLCLIPFLLNGQSQLLDDFEIAMIFASAGHGISLKNAGVDEYNVTGCTQNYSKTLEYYTILTYKFSNNLNISYGIVRIMDVNGYTKKVILSIIKKEYGELTTIEHSIVETKRKYVENNIYTETVTSKTGHVITIEDRMYMRYLYEPKVGDLEIFHYQFKDCQ